MLVALIPSLRNPLFSRLDVENILHVYCKVSLGLPGGCKPNPVSCICFRNAVEVQTQPSESNSGALWRSILGLCGAIWRAIWEYAGCLKPALGPTLPSDPLGCGSWGCLGGGLAQKGVPEPHLRQPFRVFLPRPLQTLSVGHTFGEKWAHLSMDFAVSLCAPGVRAAAELSRKPENVGPRFYLTVYWLD